MGVFPPEVSVKEERFVAGAGPIRLDRFLSEKLTGYTRAYCKDLITKEQVTVDNKKRAPAYRLTGGEIVRVRIGEAKWEAPDFEKWIIHEDKDLIIFHKPAGVIMHPIGDSWIRHPEAALDDREPTVASLLWCARPEIRKSDVERCGIVHRLDRQTSGVLIATKRAPAQKEILRGFREREIFKVYRAIVMGAPEKTRVDAPIGRLPGHRRVEVTPWGKDARTNFKIVESSRGMSLVQAEPKTGRTHQIRAHLALLGHPVTGDHEWFKEKETQALAGLGHTPPPRMMLHAYRIRFTHPSSGEKCSFTAPLPEDFKTYWKSLQK